MNAAVQKNQRVDWRAKCALLTASIGIVFASSAASAKAPPPEPFSTDAERCIVPASEFHRVNPFVLRAILNVESRLNPAAVNRNDNGTVDIGIGQMNSMHLRELQAHGITSSHLQDACIGTYVAAWHLRKQITRYGNTWFGVAAYHSATPYFNQRYQALVKNELVRMGVLQESLQRVPPLRPEGTVVGASTTRAPRSNQPTTIASEPSLVFDSSQ